MLSAPRVDVKVAFLQAGHVRVCVCILCVSREQAGCYRKPSRDGKAPSVSRGNIPPLQHELIKPFPLLLPFLSVYLYLLPALS